MASSVCRLFLCNLHTLFLFARLESQLFYCILVPPGFLFSLSTFEFYFLSFSADLKRLTSVHVLGMKYNNKKDSVKLSWFSDSKTILQHCD